MIGLEHEYVRLMWPMLAMTGFYIWSVLRNKWPLGALFSLVICIESVWALHLSTVSVTLDILMYVAGGIFSRASICRYTKKHRLDLLEDIDYPEWFLSFALVTGIAIVSHHIRVCLYQ